MANISKMERLSISLEKYHYKTGDFIDVLNMNEDEFQTVHPLFFELTTSKTAREWVSLIYYLPRELLLAMTPLQLSAIDEEFLKKFRRDLLEELYEKYKDVHDVPYNKDMEFNQATKDLSKALKEAIEYFDTPKYLDTSSRISHFRDYRFYEETNLIKGEDVAILLGNTFTPNQRQLLDNAFGDCAIQSDRPFYLAYLDKDKAYKGKLYEYDKILERTRELYTGNGKYVHAITDYVSIENIFNQFVKKGYMSTSDMNYNRKVYDFLRTVQFPYLCIEGTKVKSYIFEEIEDLLKNYINNDIIPLELEKSKKLTQLRFSELALSIYKLG